MPVINCYPKLPAADVLLGLAGIRADLEQIDEYCLALETQAASGSRNLVLWEALTSAAVVGYARCFASGVRKRLEPKVLDGAPELLIEAHEYFMELRDKHVAHSVNGYEENLLVAHVHTTSHAPSVTGLEIKSRRVLGVFDEELPKLRALVSWLLLHVRQLSEAETANVLKILREIGPEQLLQCRIEPPPLFLAPKAYKTRRPKT